MEHISGSMSQFMKQELGEFIEINKVRIREGLIISYRYAPPSDGNKETMFADKHLMVLKVMGTADIAIGFDTEELARNSIQKLDWHFKKQYKELNDEV